MCCCRWGSVGILGALRWRRWSCVVAGSRVVLLSVELRCRWRWGIVVVVGGIVLPLSVCVLVEVVVAGIVVVVNVDVVVAGVIVHNE